MIKLFAHTPYGKAVTTDTTHRFVAIARVLDGFIDGGSPRMYLRLAFAVSPEEALKQLENVGFTLGVYALGSGEPPLPPIEADEQGRYYAAIIP